MMAQRRMVVGNPVAVSPISQPAMGVPAGATTILLQSPPPLIASVAELPLHLKQLAELRSAGSLTEEEFATAKMKLLA